MPNSFDGPADLCTLGYTIYKTHTARPLSETLIPHNDDTIAEMGNRRGVPLSSGRSRNKLEVSPCMKIARGEQNWSALMIRSRGLCFYEFGRWEARKVLLLTEGNDIFRANDTNHACRWSLKAGNN